MSNYGAANIPCSPNLRNRIDVPLCTCTAFCLNPVLLLHSFLYNGYLLYRLVSYSESESHSVVSDSLWPHRLYSPWNSLGQNTGVGSLSLLQGIFWTQGSNPGLPCCRWILYKLSHQGSSRILEWVACPFSSRSSWLRNWTRVSCIAGEFFTSWAPREVPYTHYCI